MSFQSIFVVCLAGCVLLPVCTAKERRRALICATCKHVDRPENCLLFTKCDSHEVCEAEDNGDHFHLKCGSSSMCKNIETYRSNHRRFIVSDYDNMDCCRESFCNAHLFQKQTTTPKPTTAVTSTTAKTTIQATTTPTTTTTTIPCVDIGNVNCTQLLTEGNICNSVNVGQMYCRKTCGACTSSACADKPGMNCSELVQDAVNICDHPQSAKHYCAKTCHQC